MRIEKRVHALLNKVEKGGIGKTWTGRLQDQYVDFEEFEAYDETYRLAEKLGYTSAEEAWEANPMVTGSTDPADYRRVDKRVRKILRKQGNIGKGKLSTLAEIEGYDDPYDMIQAFHMEGLVPAICMNPGCDYSTMYEPDQDRGWCEVCETNTVQSCLILAGVI